MTFTPPTEFPAEYVTKDGHRGVILGERPGVLCQWIGYIHEDPVLNAMEWDCSGTCRRGGYHLQDKPKPAVWWENIYPEGPGVVSCSRRDADAEAGTPPNRGRRIACLRVETLNGVATFHVE